MAKVTIRNAVNFVEKHGALLVFPIPARPEVPSLWNCFFPRTKMNWDWSEGGDEKVPAIWHLRAALSDSRDVVYAKWLGGRATLFSLDVFTALLSAVSGLTRTELQLSQEASQVLNALEDDSPQATKQLKANSELIGRENETAFNRGLRALWNRLLIVGYGEIEEGGFPSLAVGASKLLFEDCWDESKLISPAQRDDILSNRLGNNSAFFKYFLKAQRSPSGKLPKASAAPT